MEIFATMSDGTRFRVTKSAQPELYNVAVTALAAKTAPNAVSFEMISTNPALAKLSFNRKAVK